MPRGGGRCRRLPTRPGFGARTSTISPAIWSPGGDPALDPGPLAAVWGTSTADALKGLFRASVPLRSPRISALLGSRAPPRPGSGRFGARSACGGDRGGHLPAANRRGPGPPSLLRRHSRLPRPFRSSMAFTRDGWISESAGRPVQTPGRSARSVGTGAGTRRPG